MTRVGNRQNDSVEVQDYDGNRVNVLAILQGLTYQISVGTYPCILKEIDEQPTVMRKLVKPTDRQVKLS